MICQNDSKLERILGMIGENVENKDGLTGGLVDFFYDVREDSLLNIEVAIKEDGRCAVFYNKPLKQSLAWFEYDLDLCKLGFVLDDGEARDLAIPVKKELTKNMQNTHQVLTILMDDETGAPKEGTYIPLILHSRGEQ